MFAHFQHGGHEPEVVIYHYLRHLAEPFKNLFYRFRIHDKSDSRPMPSVCDNCYASNRKSW